MQASVQSLRSIFTTLGVKAAASWGADEFKKKLGKLRSLSEDGSEIDDADLKGLFEQILQAQDAGEPVEVVDGGDDDGGDEGEETPKAKAKKSDGGRRPAGKDEKEKPAKKKGPGIIESIVEFVTAASEDKPVTKDMILNKLETRFKDHTREQMSKTVSTQLPNRLNKERNLNIVRHPEKGGYYISGSKGKAKAKK